MFTSLVIVPLIYTMLNTNQKIRIARLLSRIVVSLRHLCGKPSTVITTRRGYRWDLDLKEGIDLAIYLLGGFEIRTLRRYASLIREGDIVFDVGANIGAHTIPLAALVGARGRVVAFEPTDYAFGKLNRNLALNPTLSARVSASQTMLAADPDGELPSAIYSSWPLGERGDLHNQHHGRLMNTTGANLSTLDRIVKELSLDRVSFIKIDVDGNEYSVLKGAQETLRTHKPMLMLELAPYVYENHPHEFDQMLLMLWDCGYRFSDVVSGKDIPQDLSKIRSLIPAAGGINVLAKAL